MKHLFKFILCATCLLTCVLSVIDYNHFYEAITLAAILFCTVAVIEAIDNLNPKS